MDISYIPPYKQGLLLLYSLIIGYFSGIICGFVRLPTDVLSIIYSKKKLFCIIINILCDICISIVNIIVIILFIYAANNGIIRYFLLTAALFGIFLYKISLGRLFKALAAVLTRITVKLGVMIVRFVKKIVYPVKSAAVSRGVMHNTKKRILSELRR